MARYRNDPNYEFWKMLKVGYDNFELTKVPPKVDVCEKRYVFNQMAADGQPFSPTGACPATTQPDSLKVAYSSYQKSYDAAFSSAMKASVPPAKPTIAGIKEANIVADWSRRRARGERVTLEPPSLNADGSVTETERMGRIDSPAGRKMAALDAEKEAKRKAARRRPQPSRRQRKPRRHRSWPPPKRPSSRRRLQPPPWPSHRRRKRPMSLPRRRPAAKPPAPFRS